MQGETPWTPWGVERSADMLWIGPMRPDGAKVDDVVIGLNYDRDLTHSAQVRQLQRANLIAAAPDLYEALATFEKQWNACGPNSDFGRYFQNVRDVAVAALSKANDNHWLNTSRSAFAKARGETPNA